MKQQIKSFSIEEINSKLHRREEKNEIEIIIIVGDDSVAIATSSDEFISHLRLIKTTKRICDISGNFSGETIMSDFENLICEVEYIVWEITTEGIVMKIKRTKKALRKRVRS